jgi:hypothetical protein
MQVRAIRDTVGDDTHDSMPSQAAVQKGRASVADWLPLAKQA